MRTTFFSPMKGLRIWGEKAEWNAKFVLGTYTTENQEIISALRNHKEYGRKIVEKGLPKIKDNIIQGTRTAGTQPVFDKDQKLVRLGKLRAELLKKDGSSRKDASEDQINELKQLEKELGV